MRKARYYPLHLWSKSVATLIGLGEAAAKAMIVEQQLEDCQMFEGQDFDSR